jgi:hypothetical protein
VTFVTAHQVENNPAGWQLFKEKLTQRSDKMVVHVDHQARLLVKPAIGAFVHPFPVAGLGQVKMVRLAGMAHYLNTPTRNDNFISPIIFAKLIQVTITFSLIS